jgi:hypothetical protein
MTTLTLIAVRLAEEVLAVSARERFGGLQHLPNGGSDFLSSVWFKIAAVALFAGTAIALAAVSLYNHFSKRKIAERAFAQGASRKQLTESETSTLIAIANRAGLEKTADIFLMGDAFDRGSDMLVKESLVKGNSTNETAHLEKEVASLKEKMNFRKAAGGAYYSNGSGGKSVEVKPEEPAGVKEVFVALFPFLRKTDLINGSSTENPKRGYSPPDWREQLPKFVPATITGLVGRVLFIETALPANVGDRVLIAIGSYDVSGNSHTTELIEEIGTVDRSIYLSESPNASNLRRLGVNLAGLSESQAAQLAESIKLAKESETKKQNAQDSKETAVVSGPVGESEGSK